MFAALMLQWYTMLPQFVYTIFCFQYPVASEKKNDNDGRKVRKIHIGYYVRNDHRLLYCVCVSSAHYFKHFLLHSN